MSRPTTLRATMPSLGRFGRRVGPLLKPQRLLVGGSFAALFGEVLLRVLEPWPLQLIVDHVLLVSPQNAPQLSLVQRLDPVALTTLAALGLVTIAGLRALAAYGSVVGFALVGNRVLNEIRNSLYRRLQLLSLRYHHRARTGDLIVRIMGDVGMLKEVAVTAFLPLLGNVLIMLVMLGVMSWLNWRLTLIVAATAPLFLLTAVRKTRKIQRVARDLRRREGALATTAAESIGAIQVVQALNLDALFSRNFSRESSRSLRDGVRTKRLAAGLERSVDVVIGLATALALWFGTLAVRGGELSAGELLVFLAYLKGTFKPVRNFAKFTARIAKASASAERVLEVLDKEPEVQDRIGASAAPAFKGRVRFNRVSFAYEPGVSVLRDLSFDIEPGEMVSLVGPSGSGKSTVASLVLRLYDPSSGSIEVDGQDIRNLTVESLRRQISIVLQDTLLFSGTIYENIAYGRAEATPKEIEAAAKLANAHDFIVDFTAGYDTDVGERGVTLSAGQRQRIAIARAAVRKAPILILDEPTTGLDGENERQVTKALGRLAQNSTTLLISHELRHAATADRILFLEAGRLSEAGTHAGLMAAHGPYASLVEMGQTGNPPRWRSERVIRR